MTYILKISLKGAGLFSAGKFGRKYNKKLNELINKKEYEKEMNEINIKWSEYYPKINYKNALLLGLPIFFLLLIVLGYSPNDSTVDSAAVPLFALLGLISVVSMGCFLVQRQLKVANAIEKLSDYLAIVVSPRYSMQGLNWRCSEYYYGSTQGRASQSRLMALRIEIEISDPEEYPMSRINKNKIKKKQQQYNNEENEEIENETIVQV